MGLARELSFPRDFMSQPGWPEEGRQADQSGRRPPDDWGDQPPRAPSGMSGGMKACLILACVLGFCCLLCCGVFGYFVYTMVPKVSNTAAEVDAARGEIAQINLPAGFEPKTSAKFDNFLFSMVLVEYENPGHATLLMMEMKVKIKGADNSQLQMRQQFEQKRGSDFGPMKNAKMETKIIKIRGSDSSCTFTTYEDGDGAFPDRRADKKGDKKAGQKADNQKADQQKADQQKADQKADKKKEIRHRISGEFDGKNGMVVFEIDFDDTYKEADIVKMLESIK
jgi:hypothetical protein